mmetsp:Transcript_11686/g.48990  ORF Transcript_11686/g.48990 Transcript_11686/m.48990 type:complete len:235 (-) Transcript_11686:361-1065(-)
MVTSPIETSVASSRFLSTCAASSCFLTCAVSNKLPTRSVISAAFVSGPALGITSSTLNLCLDAVKGAFFSSFSESCSGPAASTGTSSHPPTFIDKSAPSRSSCISGSRAGLLFRSVTFSSGVRSSSPKRAMASSARACFTNALTPSANAASETRGHTAPATVTSNETRNSKRFTSRSSKRPSYLLSDIFVRTISASTSSDTPSVMSPRNTSASNRFGTFLGVIEPVGCASACRA